MKKIGAAVLGLAMAAPTWAAVPAKLIGSDLKPRDVNVQMLRDGVLTYFDNQRDLRAESVGRYLQLRFDTPASAATDQGVIELIDGQRLVGQLQHVSADGQELQWQHKELGVILVPLEQVASWSRQEATDTSATPTSDQVELLNGDVASGFVEKLAGDQVHLKPEGGAAVLTLPLANVRSLRLANPRRPAAAGTYALWLSDGSRLRAASVKVEDDRFTLVDSVLKMQSSATVPADRVQRLYLGSPGRQLIDLVDLPFSVPDGGAVFGVLTPPRRRGVNLGLHAPVTVSWELPAGARRLTAVLRLDDTPKVSATARQWADCRVTIRVGDQVISEHRLWSGEAKLEINVPLHGGVFTLTLDPGTNGPVMDRVVMEQAAVLVSE